MAILPYSEFPLHENEQAEIIRIFTDLQRRRKTAEATLAKVPVRVVRPPQSSTDLGSEWGLPGIQ